MNEVLQRARSFIRQHDLVRAESRVAAAVSGGSDSIALLHVLRELERAGDLRLAGVAHFNHQLREAADADERFVVEAAKALDLPLISDREDIRARAARERCSIEDAARRGRHEFFERARAALGADVIALGHTRDDQAETFLLRLVRGAGPRGLAGMHPKTGAIIRPLLTCRRSELRAWLADRAAAGEGACDFIEDETNADLTIPRNRVRRELLPLLAERFNPAIVDALADEAALMQEQWAWTEAASAPYLTVPGELDAAALQALPTPLQRVVLWRAMTIASGGRTISYDHVATAIRLIHTDGTADAPGVRVQRIGRRIVLTNRKGSEGSTSANQFWYPLSIPGEVHVAEAACRVSAEVAGANVVDKGRGAAVGNGTTALVRHDLVHGSLAVRNRRPADRFRPVGLRGSKKLQDLFVDRKLPRHQRDAVPLVVDDSDRILWVAEYGIDEAFRVTDSSQAVLVLRLTRD